MITQDQIDARDEMIKIQREIIRRLRPKAVYEAIEEQRTLICFADEDAAARSCSTCRWNRGWEAAAPLGEGSAYPCDRCGDQWTSMEAVE